MEIQNWPIWWKNARSSSLHIKFALKEKLLQDTEEKHDNLNFTALVN
jgi:hypothetical protein